MGLHEVRTELDVPAEGVVSRIITRGRLDREAKIGILKPYVDRGEQGFQGLCQVNQVGLVGGCKGGILLPGQNPNLERSMRGVREDYDKLFIF